MPATDIVVTTREIAWMMKSAGIDLLHVKGERFDEPLGLSSGAGTIFGATGGVMEAASKDGIRALHRRDDDQHRVF